MQDLTQGSSVNISCKWRPSSCQHDGSNLILTCGPLLGRPYGGGSDCSVGVAGNLTMIVLALTQMLGVGTTALISSSHWAEGSAPCRASLQSILDSLSHHRSSPWDRRFSLRDVYCDALSADATTASAKRAKTPFIPGLLLQFPLVWARPCAPPGSSSPRSAARF